MGGPLCLAAKASTIDPGFLGLLMENYHAEEVLSTLHLGLKIDWHPKLDGNQICNQICNQTSQY